jgi:heme o synthase
MVDVAASPSLTAGQAHFSDALPSDYITLLKPRVMFLVVFTGLAGLVAAPTAMNPILAAVAVLAIALATGGAGAINMWYDRDIDAIMERTAKRPIPMGLIEPSNAAAFGIIISIAAICIMGLAVNWLSAGLLALASFVYVFVYTIWLKRRSSQNIVIGGASGAFPPMIGWAAATDHVGLAAISLFLITFFWTPPHFWALSLRRAQDYARAGIPMLPVVRGKTVTRRHILLYTIALAPVGVLPAFIGLGGMLYLICSASMGFWMLLEAFATWRERDQIREPSAKRLFAVSLLYVFVPFAALIAERLLHLAPLWT